MFTIGLWVIIGVQLLGGARSARPVCIIPEGHFDGEEMPTVPEPRRGYVIHRGLRYVSLSLNVFSIFF